MNNKKYCVYRQALPIIRIQKGGDTENSHFQRLEGINSLKLIHYRQASIRHWVSSKNSWSTIISISPCVEAIRCMRTSWHTRFPIIPSIISWIKKEKKAYHATIHYLRHLNSKNK